MVLAEVTDSKKKRDEAILGAYFDHGYTLKDIADALKLHYTAISAIISRNL